MWVIGELANRERIPAEKKCSTPDENKEYVYLYLRGQCCQICKIVWSCTLRLNVAWNFPFQRQQYIYFFPGRWLFYRFNFVCPKILRTFLGQIFVNLWHINLWPLIFLDRWLHTILVERRSGFLPFSWWCILEMLRHQGPSRAAPFVHTLIPPCLLKDIKKALSHSMWTENLITVSSLC